MTHFIFLLQSEIPKVIASSSPDFIAGQAAAASEFVDPVRVGTYASLVAFLTVVLGQFLKSPLCGAVMKKIPANFRFLLTTALSAGTTVATAWLAGMNIRESISTGFVGLVTAILGYKKGSDLLNYSTSTGRKSVTPPPPPVAQPQPPKVEEKPGVFPAVRPSVPPPTEAVDSGKPLNVPPPSEPDPGA